MLYLFKLSIKCFATSSIEVALSKLLSDGLLSIVSCFVFESEKKIKV